MAGPTVNSFEFKKNKVLIKYDFAKELKGKNGEKLRGFEIAGINEIYYPATAKIKENKIELSFEKVSNPKHFRYGYKPFTEANLINKAGLPASTFTTEYEQKF